MSPVCVLFGHRVHLRIQRNQGFAFSRCRRCNRDMIRSTNAASSSNWRVVPPGFRVARHGPVRTPAAALQVEGAPALARGSNVADLAWIGAASLFWHVKDACTARAPRPPKMLRLMLL